MGTKSKRVGTWCHRPQPVQSQMALPACHLQSHGLSFRGMLGFLQTVNRKGTPVGGSLDSHVTASRPAGAPVICRSGNKL